MSKPTTTEHYTVMTQAQQEAYRSAIQSHLGIDPQMLVAIAVARGWATKPALASLTAPNSPPVPLKRRWLGVKNGATPSDNPLDPINAAQNDSDSKTAIATLPDGQNAS